jgi:diphosphomevalonate decarboxylase
MKREAGDLTRSGTVGWACPSNIALIKYWGKKPGQIPMNPSLSMTLQEARTITEVRYAYEPGRNEGFLRYRFEGREAPDFERRIRRYLGEVEPYLPFLAKTRLEIESVNSFPHSSGLASSASSMGALALCLVQMEEEITGPMGKDLFFQKASFLARLGSGSASRSIYPRFVLWGSSGLWENSSDYHAIPLDGMDDGFLDVRDAILVVDPRPKHISSSQGHALMEANPFAQARYGQARENLGRIRRAMLEGDWQGFISILEEEALTLHALMMTGRPGYLLMQPGTLSILRRIREYREGTGTQLGFTLDAGANVHLLYPGTEAAAVGSFIRSELEGYCEEEKVIYDKIGTGPEKYARS